LQRRACDLNASRIVGQDRSYRSPPAKKAYRLTVIDDVELARALHVLCVAHWIGGVAFVTLIVLPLARATSDPRMDGSYSNRSKGRLRRKSAGPFPSPERAGSG
jgi:hypothetical protein